MVDGGGAIPFASLVAPSAWPGWGDVVRTLTFSGGFNTNLVIGGTTLLGIAGGLIGTFGLLRRRSLMADALSHATLPGIGLAFIVMSELGRQGRSLPVLLVGAAVTGVLAVLCVQGIVRHTRLREDAAIGIVLSVFFGVGIVLLSRIQNMSVGNQGGLRSFIYGQTAAMSVSDAVLLGVIALIAIGAFLLLLKEFAIVCFNDAFARVTGWPVTLIDLLMMALVVLVTVAGLQAVGLILVVAVLIVPPAASRFWTDRLTTLVILSGIFGGLSGYLGSTISALFPREPAGGVIVLTSGAIFLLSMLVAPRRGVLASAFHRLAVRFGIATDHAVEFLYEHHEPAPNRALRGLARERGWSKGQSALVLRVLDWRGLVERTGGSVALTAAGREMGARISRNHKLWEQYLTSYADIAPSHVDWSVDQVEHVLSDDLVQELEAALAKRGVSVPPRNGGDR